MSAAVELKSDSVAAAQRAGFEIGLVLAGGGSAGAYIAGVADFLLEALSEWERARSNGAMAPSQAHRARLTVLTGASAGAMTAGMLARAVCADHRPARLPDEPAPGENRLFDCWVRLIDARKLLGSRDLDARDASVPPDPDARQLLSLLDASALHGIAHHAIGSDPAPPAPFVGEDLRVHLTVTNLRGIPYGFAFQGAGTQVMFEMLGHADHVSFALTDKPPRGYVGLDPGAGAEHAGWQRLAATAVASGAFPVGLSARTLTRDPDELAERDPLPLWFQPGHERPQPPFEFVCVDGGVVDNEPIGLARDELARCGKAPLQDGTRTQSAILLVDPFPKTSSIGNGAYTATRRWLPVISALVAAVMHQLRFKREELVAAANPNRFDQFMISPAYRDDARKLSRNDIVIGGQLLGVFGGFLDEALRRHDFQLGRRNCQAFLTRHFRLPASNPIFGWAALRAGSVDDARAAEQMVERYAIRDEHGEIIWYDWQQRVPYFPIVPLCGTAGQEVPLPLRDGIAPAIDDLGARLWNRLRKVSDALIGRDVAKYVGGPGARLAAKIFVRGIVVPRVVRGFKRSVEEALIAFRASGDAPRTTAPKEDRPIVGVFLAASVVCFAALVLLGYPFEPKLEALGRAATGAEAAGLLEGWRPQASRHRWYLGVDYAFIVSYVGLLLMLAWSAIDALQMARRVLLAGLAGLAALIGIAAGLFDGAENALRLWMIAQGHDAIGGSSVPGWAAFCTTWKWRCLAAAVGALAIPWIALLSGLRAKVDLDPAEKVLSDAVASRYGG